MKRPTTAPSEHGELSLMSEEEFSTLLQDAQTLEKIQFRSSVAFSIHREKNLRKREENPAYRIHLLGNNDLLYRVTESKTVRVTRGDKFLTLGNGGDVGLRVKLIPKEEALRRIQEFQV